MKKECKKCPENASNNKKYCDCQYIGNTFCLYDEKATIYKKCAICGNEVLLKDVVYVIGRMYISSTKVHPIPIGDFDICKYCYDKIKKR